MTVQELQQALAGFSPDEHVYVDSDQGLLDIRVVRNVAVSAREQLAENPALRVASPRTRIVLETE